MGSPVRVRPAASTPSASAGSTPKPLTGTDRSPETRPVRRSIQGLRRVADSLGPFGPDLGTGKSVVATCPSGKRLLGMGADLNTFVGQVLLDDMRPNPPLTDVTVAGFEDQDGYDGDWRVTAFY